MMTPAERTQRLGHLKDEMLKLEVLFEETELAFGDLTDEEKRSLKGLASVIEYHASKLKS
jgi:hypothetical protein|tara:strand:- start:780 stop:959 length:180 start_codon:yes stop_codon:yes gene_type:complete